MNAKKTHSDLDSEFFIRFSKVFHSEDSWRFNLIKQCYNSRTKTQCFKDQNKIYCLPQYKDIPD